MTIAAVIEFALVLRSALDLIWLVIVVCGLAAAIGSMLTALRHRHVGVDVVAVLALAGTLAVNELFAAAVIVAMLATGRVLERRAT